LHDLLIVDYIILGLLSAQVVPTPFKPHFKQ